MLQRFKRWRKQRFLRHKRIPEKLWKDVVNDALLHYHLSHHELLQLRELSSEFLDKKVFVGANNFELNDYQRCVIAATACLLILNLDMDYYDGWLEVIVYDGPFIVHRKVKDAAGVVHEQDAVLEGEAWGRGPVILAWDDIWDDARPDKKVKTHGAASNVIVHEFAHKLDMLNGAADGMPPLHTDMSRRSWIKILTRVYKDLGLQVEHHHRTRIDPYGAESPAEFFAVISECFFQLPVQLQRYYPEMYQQLCLFYRQQPLDRLN